MDSQVKGDLAELRYAAKLKELGYTILIPFTEGQHYDIVVDTGDDMVRVQVKSSTLIDDDRVKFNCFNSSTSKSGNATYYTKEMIDGLGIYNADTDGYFYIPVEEINKNTMTLNSKEGAKNPMNEYRLGNL